MILALNVGGQHEKKVGKEKLQRIIEMMNNIEDRKVDPFLLNVDEIIRIIQEYFPRWDEAEELNLDAVALHHLASVVKLQSEWVKQRSTSLYTDPFLLEEKILQKSGGEVVAAFLGAWHPLVELEQVGLESLGVALRYWAELTPLKDRWPEVVVAEVASGTATRDELIDQSILRDEAFSAELERYWVQLKNLVQEKGVDGKLLYLDFVGADSYEATVHRAYLTSFLVTYGYATLELVPLEEQIFIKPLFVPVAHLSRQAVSVPIALSFDDWQRWKRGEQA